MPLSDYETEQVRRLLMCKRDWDAIVKLPKASQLLAKERKFTHVYYSINRPLDFWFTIGRADKDSIIAVDRILFTQELLPLDEMVHFELTPFAYETIGAVALAYFHEMWGDTTVYALYKEDGRSWSARVITPSTYEAGQWQVTHLEVIGPIGHHNVTRPEDGLREAILFGYAPIRPESLDMLIADAK